VPNSSSSPNKLWMLLRGTPACLTMTKTPILLITSNYAWSCDWHHHRKHGLALFHGATPTTFSSLVWSVVFRLKFQKHFGLTRTKLNGKNSETTTGKRKRKLRIIISIILLDLWNSTDFGHLQLSMYLQLLQMHETDKLHFNVVNI